MHVHSVFVYSVFGGIPHSILYVPVSCSQALGACIGRMQFMFSLLVRMHSERPIFVREDREEGGGSGGKFSGGRG